MLYGDVVFVGQGVVVEMLNLVNLLGYCVGGIIYIIVNNQIGFIIVFEYFRFSEYCIDVVKMIGVLIFYVNGDDLEVCVWVVWLVVDF